MSADLLPALLAPYQNLTALRYDYPLVLTDSPPYVHSLTDVTNRALKQVAPRGAAGERIRHHVLRVEGAVRCRLAAGQRGPLTEVWKLAMGDVLSTHEADDRITAELDLARDALAVDGQLLDCDEQVAFDFVLHIWESLHERSCRRFRRRIDQLIVGLSGIIQSDEARSDTGRSPGRLATSVGGDHRSAFDFDAWSAILRSRPHGDTMAESRRNRIRSTLAELRAQRFVPLERVEGEADPYPFQFRSCVAATEAFRERVPEMVRLVRAMTIAELEVDNRYRDDEHDVFFDEFDQSSLVANDIELFPSYLVTVSDADLDADERAELFDLLTSELPITVLVQISDILGEPRSTDHRVRPALGQTLGLMATGLGTAFVLQTASSHLFQLRDRIRDGISSRRPALLSVFVGSEEHVRAIPAYLWVAAAVQSRVVPSFVFDPGAGSNWAARFGLEANPQSDAPWPSELVGYEDADLQRCSEPSEFTSIDFTALDRRYAGHFVVARPECRSDDMVPAAAQIESDTPDVDDRDPYILVVSDGDVIRRVIVDRRLIRAARRVGDTWHSLQELAGIHNSHALALLETDRTRGGEQDAPEKPPTSDALSATDPNVVEQAPDPPITAEDDLAAQRPNGEPWIETARCTTCDECTELNPNMFAYDENKQAYIADLSAGTYREMVLAAEACQVAIIHPGMPWDPAEPDLEALVARAHVLG